MNVKMRWVIDLSGIYIKEGVRSGKIPVWFPAKSSAVGFAWHCRTWGAESRKILMNTCLMWRSVKSMPQAIKKVPTQSEVTCNEQAISVVTSKSSFLPEEPKRRISRGYYRDIGPRSSLSMYILGLGPNLRMKSCLRRSKHCQGSPC